jgi:hypothetical protein
MLEREKLGLPPASPGAERLLAGLNLRPDLIPGMGTTAAGVTLDPQLLAFIARTNADPSGVSALTSTTAAAVLYVTPLVPEMAAEVEILAVATTTGGPVSTHEPLRSEDEGTIDPFPPTAASPRLLAGTTSTGDIAAESRPGSSTSGTSGEEASKVEKISKGKKGKKPKKTSKKTSKKSKEKNKSMKEVLDELEEVQKKKKS